MHKRRQLSELQDRLSGPRRFMQVLYGPRQVGKTTLVRQLMAEWSGFTHYAAADGEAVWDAAWLNKQWELVRAQGEGLLIIDEIQKIDNWSERVKQLWDEDTWAKRPIKLVLLGSSRMLLQQGLSESMAGWFETTYMPHWSLAEMEQIYQMTPDQYVYFGGYPGTADLIDEETRWQTYLMNAIVETSVSRDILMLTRVDKPALLKRLFELGCAYSGQEMSYTKMMGQLQDAGNTVTLAHYLNLLDKAGLLSGLQKYAGALVRKRGSSPKFFVHNTALLSAVHGGIFKHVRADGALWGHWVESAVGAHLLNTCQTQGVDVYYWRDGIDEVDFVLQQGKRLVAIEVKSGLEKSSNGLEKFVKQFKPYRYLLVGNGGIPWPDFLRMDPKKLFD